MQTVYFAIPLRAKATARDWSKVSRLLETTLASALNQEGAEARAIVCCNDMPDTAFNSDPRVEFLMADLPLPTSLAEQRKDKGQKKRRIAAEIIKRGGYMALLDADDLVSNRLVAYIQKNDNRRGYYYDQGIIYDAGKGTMVTLAKGFKDRCGTSAVFYLSPDDIGGPVDWVHEIGTTRHMNFKSHWAELDRPLDAVPFPAAIAVKGNGENVSLLSALYKKPSLMRFARQTRELLAQRPVSPRVMAEYGLRRSA